MVLRAFLSIPPLFDFKPLVRLNYWRILTPYRIAPWIAKQGVRFLVFGKTQREMILIGKSGAAQALIFPPLDQSHPLEVRDPICFSETPAALEGPMVKKPCLGLVVWTFLRCPEAPVTSPWSIT